jgi:Xaa-Pro aminopeptidase
MNFIRRITSLRHALQSRKLDFLLVTHLPNLQYLCGFTGSSGALLVGQNVVVLFTDGRYTEQARLEASTARTIISRGAPEAAACRWLCARQRSDGNALGIESERLTVAARARLRKRLPARFRLRDTGGLVERLRMVKDADEIACIRAAVHLASGLFQPLLKVIRPGVRESEVAAELEYLARKRGAQEMSFPTIVASGPRAALPHGRASEQAIPAKGFVVLDFGVILKSYCSDMTRTLYVGTPGREARVWYGAVKEAQQAAMEAVRPGIPAGEVDRAARRALQSARLARYFTHSTGHGVGLEIHEAPRVATGEPEVLRPGMVITIEPGIYVSGRGGIRIEDMVVVTEGGCEILTPTTKDLLTL